MYHFENLEDHKSTETRQIIITRICALKVYFQPNWQKKYKKLNMISKKKSLKPRRSPKQKNRVQ